MATFLKFDINFFSVMLLLVVLITFNIKNDLVGTSGRIFKRLIWINIFMLIMEVISWQFDGLQGSFNWYMNYLSNMIFAWSSPLISCVWVGYIDYHMFGSYERLRKRWYYLHPMIANTIFMIINLFKPFIFSVSPENVYSREPFMWLIIVLNSTIILHGWYMAYMHRASINKEIIIAMLLYVIMPAIASVIQVLVYGAFILWPTMAITIVITYIFLDTVSTSKDYLTGLLSRNRVDAHVDYLIGKGENFGLVMIDLDGFKAINDTHGHIQGDKALQIFARILKECVTKAKLMGRYGGDEFIIVMDEMTDQEIEICHGKIIKRLEEANEKLPFNIAFSMGYHLWRAEEKLTYEALVEKADQKMYDHKKST